jgi:aspartyl-tRNA synthetase
MASRSRWFDRIPRRDVQALVFKALGMTEEQARTRFGFSPRCIAFGTPPHGGIASGIERTLMVLVPTEKYSAT